MLITFKSHACGDVILHENNAKEILDLLSNRAEIHHGILTVDQLAPAIAVLKKALVSDHNQLVEDAASSPDTHTESESEAIHLFQRAAPILALLEQSLTEEVPVTWEAG